MNGILIIDKPVGLTSHDVVSRLRRILKTKSIGHTGTLDPFATGVLVMLIGKATRLARFLDKDEKEYQAVVRFGFETDTGDCTGSPKSHVSSPKSLTIGELETVLPEFRGSVLQTPPMYSAKKVEGKKLYELARNGIEIERKPVSVNVSKLEITDKAFEKGENDLGHETWDLGLRVSCSAGTYIRTLAEDMGKRVGVGAHLAELRRIRAGKFDLSKAVTIEELEEIVVKGEQSNISIPMNEAISHLPSVVLSNEELEKTKNGMKYVYENSSLGDEQPIRMNDHNGELAAIGFYKRAEKYVQPKVVLL
jgi:tRNA pseudouridine55 synthase